MREKARNEMHGCLYLFTDELPSMEDVSKLMKPYDEWEEDVDRETAEFTWDCWTLGGRYAGNILTKVSSINKTEDYTSYEAKEVVDIEVISRLFNMLKPMYKTKPISMGWPMEHSVFGYIMNREDGSIRVDGAKVRAITNKDDLGCYIFMDKDEAYCRDNHKDDFDRLFNEMLDKYYEKDGFLTVLDIHW